MSSTNRGATRREHDAYLTPPEVADACVGTLPSLAGAWVVEPSVGGWAFADAIGDRQPFTLTTVDVDPARSADIHADWCDVAREDLRRAADWPGVPEAPEFIVGNPPFSEAEAHVRHALDIVADDGVVAFLLRAAFMEGGKRAAFWSSAGACLESVHILAERPNFTGGGTDSAAYGWFVWRKGYAGPARVVPGWSWRGR